MQAQKFGTACYQKSRNCRRKTLEGKIQPPTDPLSNREREVLALIAKGQSNKQIAATLFITERTVKFHVSAILRKLDVANRAEAVQKALTAKLINIW